MLDWQTIGESDSADVSWTDHVIHVSGKSDNGGHFKGQK